MALSQIRFPAKAGIFKWEKERKGAKRRSK
jgi:hypothetical protein